MRRFTFVLVILMLLGICLCGCRTRYIPVETVKTEVRFRDSIRHDSIYQQDSVYMRVKGDTVYLYKYKYLYKYQYINKTDTLMKTDSIQIPLLIEKQLSKWQQFKLDVGGIALLVVIVMLVVRVAFKHL